MPTSSWLLNTSMPLTLTALKKWAGIYKNNTNFEYTIMSSG